MCVYLVFINGIINSVSKSLWKKRWIILFVLKGKYIRHFRKIPEAKPSAWDRSDCRSRFFPCWKKAANSALLKVIHLTWCPQRHAREDIPILHEQPRYLPLHSGLVKDCEFPERHHRLCQRWGRDEPWSVSDKHQNKINQMLEWEADNHVWEHRKLFYLAGKSDNSRWIPEKGSCFLEGM